MKKISRMGLDGALNLVDRLTWARNITMTLFGVCMMLATLSPVGSPRMIGMFLASAITVILTIVVTIMKKKAWSQVLRFTRHSP